MNILILGGTRFLGRFLTEAALSSGHEVTLLNRGKANPDLFPEVEKLIGDRYGDLQALRGRRWDAVIDTSGYLPWSVQESAELLAKSVGHYTFISSASVYVDLESPGINEEHAVGQLSADELEELKTKEAEAAINEHYGELKFLCEQEVERAFPEGALNIRPGLIVGPYDFTDRFTYWVNRVDKGGEVLAPGRRDKEIQFIDVRDLADWILRLVEEQRTGTFNATGPESALTMEKFLEECKATLKSDADFIWVDEQFLLGHKVEGWSELPLWIPDSMNLNGFLGVDIQKALQTGLRFRPLSDTIRATFEWEMTREKAERKAGMDPEKEQAVLKDWQQRAL
ncbi:NAD-dependent epimerase/dehydratase family protein [Planococcus ruber]|uniref:NAD-dependent epimerase/dehydratase family protein n=1 Tax=Planococcus ruber TaxID=2027871 RepID=UPI001FED9E9D|nr:NAD-dependent epimerase/dehydratase family protein [Planococcus ruber]